MQALGRKIGVTYQQIQKYERGTNRVSVSTLYRIAGALDVDAGWFFADLAEPKQNDDPALLLTARSLAALDPRVRQALQRLIEAIAAESGTRFILDMPACNDTARRMQDPA